MTVLDEVNQKDDCDTIVEDKQEKCTDGTKIRMWIVM